MQSLVCCPPSQLSPLHLLESLPRRSYRDTSSTRRPTVTFTIGVPKFTSISRGERMEEQPRENVDEGQRQVGASPAAATPGHHAASTRTHLRMSKKSDREGRAAFPRCSVLVLIGLGKVLQDEEVGGGCRREGRRGKHFSASASFVPRASA